MTKLSKWPVQKEKMSLFLDDFWTAVASLKSKEEARSFFNQFFTHTERKMFAKRFQIAIMLILKYDYQTIRNRVKTSDVTIAKINNWIEENREVLIAVGQRIIQLKERKANSFETKKSYKGRSGGHSVVSEGLGEIVDLIDKKKKQESLSH